MISPDGIPDTEEQEIKLDLGVLSSCSDAILSPLRRSTRQNKFCQKVETGRTSARRGKTVHTDLSPSELFMNALRRKRTCPCKRARSSVWGSYANINLVKENEVAQKDGGQLYQVENRMTHKKRPGPRNGRRRKGQAGGKGECSALNDHAGHVHLKVKLGGQTDKNYLHRVQPEMFDSPISIPTVVGECAIRSGPGAEFSKDEYDVKSKLEDNLFVSEQYAYANGDLENPVSFSCSSFLDPPLMDKDLESTVTQDTSAGNSFGNFPRGYCKSGTEALEGAMCKQYSDPGTSPDSEVTTLIQDDNIGIDVILTTTSAVASIDAVASNLNNISLSKQKRTSKVKGAPDSLCRSFDAEEKSLGQKKKKKSGKHRRVEKMGHGCIISDTSRLGSDLYDARNFSNTERYANESTETGNIEEVETINGSCELSGDHFGSVRMSLLDAGNTSGLNLLSKSNKEVRKRNSADSVSERNRRKNARGKEDTRMSVNKGKIKEMKSSSHVVQNGESPQETGGCIGIPPGMTQQTELREPDELMKIETMGLEIPNDPRISLTDKFASEDLSKSSVDGQLLPPPAWVRCDDCHKWRCISTVLADSIEATNCRWTCTDNMDKTFADCLIPQEKSNEEINAELEISEFSGEEDASDAHPVGKGVDAKQYTVPQQAPWKPIESNLFLHRSRKNHTIDEIMICHCKPPLDGGLGCGEECLNRMLNIECVRGTCPCGDRCSNQQFQKRKYAKLECFRCGKKGYGLQLLENVSEGDFLIEYVGEVLDLNAYEARQREYASRGQRHFYFMTLNGSEVIDACVKGNLGRFINHSCDPNCRTEKWMVKGEVCIGLFAIRNIKKGEELTFDYNYVRVFGAAAKKCVCGSSECRGYIGGDPSNTDVVVQGDSDEEYPEPVMLNGDDRIEKVKGRMPSNTILSDSEQLQCTDQMIASGLCTKPLMLSVEKEESTRQSGLGVQPIEILFPKEDVVDISLSAVQPLDISIKTEVVEKSSSDIIPLEISLPKENILCKTLPTIQLPDATDNVKATGKSTPDTVEKGSNISKARSRVKSSCPSNSIKKSKCRPNLLVSGKPQIVANKSKVVEGAANSCPKGVEETLNELLDTGGGISKQKDSTKCYLILLFETSSNVNGEAAQSTRDLSIILDALLKTKRWSVLNDIINKNGLQMLHNIMIQNRKNFSRIPIIRKILKILEYLGEKEILTLEMVNSVPPCAGKESFRESIIRLANHRDIKVHQAARNFRDKWMRRTFKRSSYSKRDDINVEHQAGLSCHTASMAERCSHSSRSMGDNETKLEASLPYANIHNKCSGPSVNSCPSGTNIRKRKSRWNQPEDGKFGRRSLEITENQEERRKLLPSLHQSEIREALQGQVDEVNYEAVYHSSDRNISRQDENFSTSHAVQQLRGEGPPGFPSPSFVPDDIFIPSTSNPAPDNYHRNCSCELVTGCLQTMYLSDLPVSYGIPLFSVVQLGTPQGEMVDSWEISAAIPFHPFPPLPPLPPYPLDKRNTLPQCALMNVENGESQRDSHLTPHNRADTGIPCTSGMRPGTTGAYKRPMDERWRHSAGNLGRRYFWQQKGGNARRFPWDKNRTR